MPKPFVQAVNLVDLERQLSNAALRLPVKTAAPWIKSAAPSTGSDAPEAERGLIGQDSRISVIHGSGHQQVPVPTLGLSQTMSKASVQRIDLDDLEQQLLGVASTWPSEPQLPVEKSGDARAEPALLVGRTEQQRAITGASSHVAPATPALPSLQGAPSGISGASPGDLQFALFDAQQGRHDLEGLIPRALRADPLHAESEPRVIPREARQVESAPARGSNGRSDPFFGDDPRHIGMSAASPDGVAGVAAVPGPAFARRASARRSLVSRTARSLAVPLLFVAGSAAAVIYADPEIVGPQLSANDAPTAKIGAENPAPAKLTLLAPASPDKPDQSVGTGQAGLVAAPSPASPGDAESTKETASSGAGLASGRAAAADAVASNTNDVAARARPAEATPSAASADLVPPAQSPAATAPEVAMSSAPTPAADPSAPSTSKATGAVPLDGSRPATQRPSQPAQARPMAATPADATPSVSAPSGSASAVPSPKKPALPNRAQPTAVIAAADPQTPAVTSIGAGGEADRIARGRSDARGANALVTPPAPPRGVPDRQGVPSRMADVAPARALGAPPAPLGSHPHPNLMSGSSTWVGVVSSASESDARATLAQLQKQFPGKLAASSIRRDDRGGAGVVYRVRTGPLPLDAAAKICSAVRATGKSCVLTNG